MSNRVVLHTIMLLIFGILPICSYAKRVAAIEVKPILKNGILYSKDRDDFIVAKDKKSGILIWKRQIYVVKYRADLERDVQDCHITNIDLKGDCLLITNEEGYKYLLDIHTLKVKVIKGSLLIDRSKCCEEK